MIGGWLWLNIRVKDIIVVDVSLSFLSIKAYIIELRYLLLFYTFNSDYLTLLI